MRPIGVPVLLLAAVVAASIVSSQCSSSGGNAAAVVPHPSPSPTLPGANLYVVNLSAANFVQYQPPFGASSTPSLTFASDAQTGVASDLAYIAVTNNSNDDIVVYTQPLTSQSIPAYTIVNAAPTEFAAFDGLGNLWVTSTNNTVEEFTTPLSSSSIAALTVSTDVSDPIGIAFDASNNLYVVNGDTDPVQLLVFASPYTAAPTILGLPATNPAEAEGVAVSNNELAVGIFSQNTDARIRSGSRSSIASVVRRRVWTSGAHRAGSVFPQGVEAGGEVLIYSLPISASSAPTVSFPLTEAGDVAFDAAGDLYVSDFALPGAGGGVLVFDPPFTSSSTPTFSITTGIDTPEGLNFGP
jgi:hypothetical protein